MATHTASKEARKRAQAKYDAKHKEDFFNFYVKLKKDEDRDIIEHLQTKESRAAYIRELIRKDMASGN